MMIRSWIGTALLAGSWLLGIGYFYPASPWAWLLTVAMAVVLLGKSSKPLAASQLDAVALVLFLPAVWYAAWPYRMAPLLIVLGLAIRFLPTCKRWIGWAGQGALAAGVILLVQSLALELYAAHTMHSHELPALLPDLLASVAGLLGIDTAVDGSTIVVRSMRQTHRLGATWELLLDPATLLFFVGGLTMLALRRNDERNDECGMMNDGCQTNMPVVGNEDSLHPSSLILHPSQGWSSWIRGLRALTLVMLAWLPMRAGLLMALYLHRVLRSDPDRPLHAMNHFFSPWMLILLLIPPVLLAWRFVRAKKLSLAPASTRGELVGKENMSLAPASTRGAVNGETRKAKHSTVPLGTEVPSPQTKVPSPRVEVPGPESASNIPLPSPFSLLLSAGLIALAVALCTAAIYWNPVGSRKEGRVMVVERHSKWEPTTKPYDTTWFVKPEMFPDVNSGYNYARIYRYLGQYDEMSRLLENDKIDDDSLAKCDVLIIKTPTERYSAEEAAAVVRFVERGGGLLLIGDHTNFERSATIMNDMTRPMGFIFRDDVLFGFTESSYDQPNEISMIPHPAVHHVPPFDFAGTCSIDPGFSSGRAIISNTGLWSMGPEYHNENYFPVPNHCPEMRYGAFVQAWAAWHGNGRAIAFTDSTLFSNCCVGQLGKTELMLGMVEWLNHGNPRLNPRPWLLVLGLLSLAAGFWTATNRPKRGEWIVLLAAGTFGWAFAALAVAGAHLWAMPSPECVRPERCAVIDRTTSTAPLSKGMYIVGEGNGYGLLEQWLARLDCHTVQKEGSEAFTGDVLVAICPTRSVSEEFRQQLEQYVNGGGKLLVIDSPENTSSTAYSLLWPFGVTIHHDRKWKGKLNTADKLPAVDVDVACEVVGGDTVARIGQYPVAAVTRHGKGSVMAVGFGSLWNDTRMGETWMMEPDVTVKSRYNAMFSLLRTFFDDKPWPAFPPPSPEKVKDEKESGLKESGPAEM